MLITGSIELLLSADEIKISNTMKEGTVPVLPCRPCAQRDEDVLPVQELRIFLCEHKEAGVEPL
jgi:hypothetical protein